MSRRRAAEPPAPAHVSISVGGHQVVVEACGPLDDVAAKAMEVWNATDSPQARLSHEPVGFGASAHISDPVPAAVLDEFAAPDHLNPTETVR